MRRSLTITLLLLVLLPLGLLAWLGQRLVGAEREEVRQAFHALLADQLADLERTVIGVIERRDLELRRLSTGIVWTTPALRKLIRDTPWIKQAFLLDGRGRRIHPPPAAPRSRAEDEFLERASQALADRSVFRSSAVGEADNPAVAPHGWYRWFHGAGLHLLHWQRGPDGRVLGVELDRYRLLADVLDALPAETPTRDGPDDRRIELVDARGEVLYRWGRHAPAEGEAPVAVRALGPPLRAWQLRCYAGPAIYRGELGLAGHLPLIAGLLAVGLALIGLALYLHRESARELREAAQRVSFVNHVSHELKTPLTNIRMYAELLQEQLEDTQDAPGERYLDVVVAESQRLSRLIDNVLTFSRHQRGTLKLHPRAEVVDQVLRRVLDALGPSLAERGLEVDFTAGADAPVRVDADALEQMVGNLLSNVEKYAPASGVVELTSRQDGATTTVTVQDRGPGIPASERQRVFEPFVRARSDLTEGVAGTGIGLSITRELARRHGGDLRLRPSERGACFALTLETPPATSGESGS